MVENVAVISRMKRQFRVTLFVAIALAARFLLDRPLHEIGGSEVVSTSWFYPYLHLAVPDICFFFLVGLIAPFIFGGGDQLRIAIGCCAVFVVVRLLFHLTLGSSYVADWRGYLVLSAPYVGTILGFAVGMITGRLISTARPKEHT